MVIPLAEPSAAGGPGGAAAALARAVRGAQPTRDRLLGPCGVRVCLATAAPETAAPERLWVAALGLQTLFLVFLGDSEGVAAVQRTGRSCMSAWVPALCPLFNSPFPLRALPPSNRG